MSPYQAICGSCREWPNERNLQERVRVFLAERTRSVSNLSQPLGDDFLTGNLLHRNRLAPRIALLQTYRSAPVEPPPAVRRILCCESWTISIEQSRHAWLGVSR